MAPGAERREKRGNQRASDAAEVRERNRPHPGFEVDNQRRLRPQFHHDLRGDQQQYPRPEPVGSNGVTAKLHDRQQDEDASGKP